MAKASKKASKLSMGSERNLAISLQSIRLATNDFSEGTKLGEGGEATVFRGVSPNGGKPWAVKRLKERADPKYFIREVEAMARRRHAHVVELLGFCEEARERVLVYEFMDKGSLKNLLQRQKNGSDLLLPFDQRVAIAEGAAEGLRYLHESLDILHRDVKTDNILINDKFVAKLADFGTVQDGAETYTSRVPFTIGYVAPECISARRCSKKGDVYSFGVVLLELLSGKRAVVDEIDETGSSRRTSLADWALKHTKDLQSLVDPPVWAAAVPRLGKATFRAYADLALRCVHKKEEERPDIRRVVRALGRISSTFDEEEEKEKGEVEEEGADVARMSLSEELRFAMNDFSNGGESMGGSGQSRSFSSTLAPSFQSLGLESSVSSQSSTAYSETRSDTFYSLHGGRVSTGEGVPGATGGDEDDIRPPDSKPQAGSEEVAEKLPFIQPQLCVEDQESVLQITLPPPQTPQSGRGEHQAATPGGFSQTQGLEGGRQQGVPGGSFSQSQGLAGSGVEASGRRSMEATPVSHPHTQGSDEVARDYRQAPPVTYSQTQGPAEVARGPTQMPPVNYSQTQGLVDVARRYDELSPVNISQTQVMSAHTQNPASRSLHEVPGGSFSQAQGGGSFPVTDQRGYGEIPAPTGGGWHQSGGAGGAVGSGGVGWQTAGGGMGEDVDHRAAFDRHREAARCGDVAAKFNMAACLELGMGSARDMRQAVELYRECAQRGNWKAKYNLGLCYQYGKEVERDAEAAVRNFREASEAGSVEAWYSLGVCHETGAGVPQDVKEAAKMYKWAAEGGYSGAGQELNRIHTANGWLRNIV